MTDFLDAEVGIIGAGPIGIELAANLKHNGISYLLFDKEQVGQMIFNFPPQTHFFSSNEHIALGNLPLTTLDQQKSTREEYLNYLRTFITQHALNLHAYESVESIVHGSNFFTLGTISAKGSHSYFVRYVVFATGGTSYPRMLGVDGENLPHVSTKMGDPHQYFQKNVLIIGARNSAAETALRCLHAGAKVALAVRNPLIKFEEIKYWIAPELKGHIERNDIMCFTNTSVQEILPYKVLLKRDEHLQWIAADFVIKAIGFEADVSLLEKAGVTIRCERRAPVYDMRSMETNVSNVFVAGTIVGGTQDRYRVFIENCHMHADKITQELCKRQGKTFYALREDAPAKKLPEAPEE